MSQTERVPLSEVRDLIVVGEPLPFRVLDEPGRLLLNQGQMVATERQFETLVERGAWVERPQVEAVRAARTTASATPQAVAKRLLTVFDLWDSWAHDFGDLLRRASKGRALAGEFESHSDALTALVTRDADVALYICTRQNGIQPALYPTLHAMHCAVAAALTATQLAWPAEQVLSLARAALTMNISAHDLQATLAEQHEPPSHKQLEALRAHPHAAAAMLRTLGVSDALWLQTVEDHHEQSDGKGYPRGVVPTVQAAQLLRIVDVYMAKITGRAGRAPLPPVLAARQLFQQQGMTPLASGLIRTLGVHPPGALVQLQSGEVAVVSRRGKSGPAPMVATLSNKQGKPAVKTEHRDSAVPEFAISGPLMDARGFSRVLPERVFGMVMA